MRRALTKDTGPGLWETLLGRVEAGETPLETAQREVREECGLTVTVKLSPVTAHPTTHLDKPMIVIVYAANFIHGEVVLSDNHDDYRRLVPEAFAKFSTLASLIQAARLAFTL